MSRNTIGIPSNTKNNSTILRWVNDIPTLKRGLDTFIFGTNGEKNACSKGGKWKGNKKKFCYSCSPSENQYFEVERKAKWLRTPSVITELQIMKPKMTIRNWRRLFSFRSGQLERIPARGPSISINHWKNDYSHVWRHNCIEIFLITPKTQRLDVSAMNTVDKGVIRREELHQRCFQLLLSQSMRRIIIVTRRRWPLLIIRTAIESYRARGSSIPLRWFGTAKKNEELFIWQLAYSFLTLFGCLTLDKWLEIFR